MVALNSSSSNRISSCLLFATIAAAPLPFGSTEPVAIAFWCIVLGIALTATSPRRLRYEHLPLIGLAAIVVLAYAFVLHEQLTALPWIASPNHIWREAAEVLHIPITPSVSIARNEPFFALGAPLASTLAMICSFIICIDRNRAHQLLSVIAWSGVVYAVYGIAAYLFDPIHLLWREKITYRDVLTSTFTNRNTAATYFGSCSVLWLLLLSQYFRRRLLSDPIHWRGAPDWFLSEMPRPVLISLVMLLLCVTAMLMTSSRAGITLSLFALIIAFTIFFHRDFPHRGVIVLAVAIGGLFALLLLQVLGGKVSGRFDMQGLSDEGRLETYRSTLKIIADHPWFGTGLGTFAWSFPAFRSTNVSMCGVWDRAHSTPLELASDLGLPLTGLIVASWFIILGMLIRGVRSRHRDLIVPVGALTVASLGLAHSVIDFSLQVPGYSIIVFALVGAGLAQSFSSEARENACTYSSEKQMQML